MFQRLGSIRGEDISYIFGLPLVGGGAFFSRNYSRQDQTVAEAVLTFFTNFAKTGNPNEPHKIESVDYGTPKEKTRYRGLTWEQYETGTQQYLTIGMFLLLCIFFYCLLCIEYKYILLIIIELYVITYYFSYETKNEEPLSGS